MNAYARAFRAIDAVLSWSIDTAATTYDARMAKVNAEADKLRSYIDSRLAMLADQSMDARFKGVPVGPSPYEELDDQRTDDADKSADYRSDKLMTIVCAGLGAFLGALLGYVFFGFVVL